MNDEEKQQQQQQRGDTFHADDLEQRVESESTDLLLSTALVHRVADQQHPLQ